MAFALAFESTAEEYNSTLDVIILFTKRTVYIIPLHLLDSFFSN